MRTCLFEDCGLKTAGARSLHCVHCGRRFPSKEEIKLAKVEHKEEENLKTVAEQLAEERSRPEIVNFQPGWIYPDGFIYPFDTKVVNLMDGVVCPWKIEWNGAKLPSDSSIIRWANEIRTHMLGIHGVFVTNGCLYDFLAQQFRGTFDHSSDEMKYVKLLLSDLPDVRRAKPSQQVA
jgi:hypothetical protein